MEKNLKINKLNVHYYEWGENSKPSIIFLHGLGNSGAAFLELAGYLKNNYHILSFDNPGHGGTSPFKNEKDYLFSNLAEWYNRVFQQVIKKPFYLLGHSWGGDIALHYAKQHPEKIEGVILLDGGYTFPHFQEEMTFSVAYEGWSHYMDHSAAYDNWEDVIKEYQQYTKRWNGTIEEMVSTLFIKNEKYKLISSKFTVLAIIKSFFKEQFAQTYPYIKRPLVLLHATLPEDLDKARLKGITKMKQDIDDLTIVPIKDSNHMVHWEEPAQIAYEIDKWINQHRKNNEN